MSAGHNILIIVSTFRLHLTFDSKPATQEDEADHHQSQRMRWMIKKDHARQYYACARTASVNMMQWHLQRKGREIIIKQT